MSSLRERGFTAVEVLITILVIAAVAGIGWVAFDRMRDDPKTATQQTSTDDTTAVNTPAVNETKDLDAASQTLDDTNLDAGTSDSSELDSQLSAF